MAVDAIFYAAADAVLAALGISPPPATSVNLLVAWELAEWGDTQDLALTNNPMADELPEPGATDWNSAGVKIYPSLQVGAQATATSLQGYPTLLGALRTGNAATFFSGAGLGELSTWASGSSTGDLAYAQRIQSLYQGLPPPPAGYLGGQGGGAPAAPFIPGWAIIVGLAVWFIGSEEYRAHRAGRTLVAELDTDLAQFLRRIGLGG